MKILGGAFLALLAAVSMNASADPGRRIPGQARPALPPNSMIEVGTGARVSSERAVDILIQAEFAGIPGGRETCPKSVCLQTYYARIEADFAVGTEHGDIPDYRVTVVPGSLRWETGASERFGVDVIPIDVSRDIRLGETSNVSIRAISGRANFPLAGDLQGEFALAASIAIEAMGLRISRFADSYVDESGEERTPQDGRSFLGFDLADIAAELRAFFRLNPDMGLTFALGAAGGASTGWLEGDSGAWYLRREAYFETRLNLGRFVQLFMRAGTETSFGSARSEDVTLYEAMSGIRVIY